MLGLAAALGFVVLPTQGGAELEQTWHAEMQGLRADLISHLACPRSAELRPPTILILGDWNVQAGIPPMTSCHSDRRHSSRCRSVKGH